MIKGLYIHIPFCDKICLYCDFNKMVASTNLKTKYIDVLIKELIFHKDKYSNIDTIYIGGGTPSSLSKKMLDKLLQNISSVINLESVKEYTIEANPNDISKEFIKIIQKYKVNRISIGVQTTDKELLKLLKRTHSTKDVVKSINLLRDNNFNNINLDFIYGIPKQTFKELLADINFIQKIKPPHISYYSLIIEEQTELSYLIDKKEIKALDVDLIADFSDYIHEALLKLGYNRYEISNYSIKGYESKHNLIYWNLEEYLGIGLNAASQYDNKRFINEKMISSYLRNVLNNDYTKNEEDFNPKMEYILMGLRKIQGIDLDKYNKKFKTDIFKLYPGLIKHLDSGLLVMKDKKLYFSQKGLDLSNQVYLEII